MANGNDLVTVFKGASMEAAMARSLLISNGIPAYMVGEIMAAVAPWYGSPGGSASVRVQVAEKDVDAAKQVLSKDSG